MASFLPPVSSIHIIVTTKNPPLHPGNVTFIGFLIVLGFKCKRILWSLKSGTIEIFNYRR